MFGAVHCGARWTRPCWRTSSSTTVLVFAFFSVGLISDCHLARLNWNDETTAAFRQSRTYHPCGSLHLLPPPVGSDRGSSWPDSWVESQWRSSLSSASFLVEGFEVDKNLGVFDFVRLTSSPLGFRRSEPTHKPIGPGRRPIDVSQPREV